MWGHGCPASATSLDTKEMEWSQQCLGCVSGVRPAGPIPAPGSSIPVPPWGPAGHVPPQDPPGPPQGPPFPIPPWGHLQPFGSVDGPERTEHPQHPQDFHHGDGAGPGGSQGGAEGRLLPPALHTSARLPVPPVNAACALPQDGGATCPGAGLVGAPLGLPLGLPADWGTQAPGPGPPGGGRTTPPPASPPGLQHTLCPLSLVTSVQPVTKQGPPTPSVALGDPPLHLRAHKPTAGGVPLWPRSPLTQGPWR